LSRFGRSFDPAHSDLHPDVRAALMEAATLCQESALPHIARASLRLRPLFRTADPVLLLPAPAAVLREIGLAATIVHRALVLISGPEGEALADAAEALGKEVVRVVVAPGRSVKAAHLARFLAGQSVDTVALVHAESGTGALAPLAELAAIVRARRDLLLYVDASASLGATAVESAAWGLDFVLAPSEGPIGLPPGLSFAVVSGRLVDRARALTGRGRQLDLLAHYDAAVRGRTLTPVALPLAVALDRHLERIVDGEGLPRRWARHQQMRRLVEDWARKRPQLTLLAAGDGGAHAVSCLALPEGQPAALLLAVLEAQGWRAAPGVGADAQRYLRIGHMGDLEPEHLAGLLEALGRALEGMSFTPP
jgi:aspartate aminotransferase-like enzyme